MPRVDPEYLAQIRIERAAGLYDRAQQRRRENGYTTQRDAEAAELAAEEARASRHLVSDADRR